MAASFLVGNEHVIDLDFHQRKATVIENEQEAVDYLDKYRKRVYAIIHSGYNLGEDSKPIPPEGKVIDGKTYHSKTAYGAVDGRYWQDPVDGRVQHEARASYYPSPVRQRNSDYMGDYTKDVGACLKRWQDEGSIVNLNQHPEYAAVIRSHGHCELKLTIEPS